MEKEEIAEARELLAQGIKNLRVWGKSQRRWDVRRRRSQRSRTSQITAPRSWGGLSGPLERSRGPPERNEIEEAPPRTSRILSIKESSTSPRRSTSGGNRPSTRPRGRNQNRQNRTYTSRLHQISSAEWFWLFVCPLVTRCGSQDVGATKLSRKYHLSTKIFP